MKSMQQIFDEAFCKLIDQGKQSRGQFVNYKGDGGDGCVYHNKDRGLCCVVGGLIPPEIDTAAFEGIGVRLLVDPGLADTVSSRAGAGKLAEALRQSEIDVDSLEVMMLLADMQDVHDTVPQVWLDQPMRLRKFFGERALPMAEAKGLRFDAVEAKLLEYGITKAMLV